MKSAEEIAIEVIGKLHWRILGKNIRQDILKIARAYAAQYEGNTNWVNEGPDKSGGFFSRWKDDRNQDDVRNQHDGDEPVIGHFRD